MAKLCRILALGKSDAWYDDRKLFIGLVGMFEENTNVTDGSEFVSGTFKNITPTGNSDTDNKRYFHAVSLEEVK
jgi:hypothetical protein